MVMVRVDRRFCGGDGRGGNRAFFFFLILLWWWTQTLSPGKTLWRMPYRWQLCHTIISDVDLSSLSTTASPLSAMVPASSLVAQSENFFSLLFFFPCCSKWRLFLSSISLSMRHTVDGDVCHFSYSQVGLLWSWSRALLLRLLCWLQVEQNKTPNLDKAQDKIKPNLDKAIKNRQDITGEQDKTPNPDEAQDKIKHLILTWQ